MSRTKVMLIGALPVGAGNQRMPMYNGGGESPAWRTNFFTNAATVTDEPQNLLRVTAAGMPFTMSSGGMPGVQLDTHMLGRLGSFLRGPGDDVRMPLSSGSRSIRQRYEDAVANNPRLAVNTITAMGTMMSVMGAAIGGYHGFKRTGGKVGPMLGWGLAGAVFPVITTGVSLVQGVGVRKRG